MRKFKYFHQFLRQCAKARLEHKPYSVSFYDGKYILEVYDYG